MINMDAAGIDIGSGEHWVAVPEDGDEGPGKPVALSPAGQLERRSYQKENRKIHENRYK